jgi:hypothetical protein
MLLLLEMIVDDISQEHILHKHLSPIEWMEVLEPCFFGEVIWGHQNSSDQVSYAIALNYQPHPSSKLYLFHILSQLKNTYSPSSPLP